MYPLILPNGNILSYNIDKEHIEIWNIQTNQSLPLRSKKDGIYSPAIFSADVNFRSLPYGDVITWDVISDEESASLKWEIGIWSPAGKLKDSLTWFALDCNVDVLPSADIIINFDQSLGLLMRYGLDENNIQRWNNLDQNKQNLPSQNKI